VPITTNVVNSNPAHGKGVLDTTLCEIINYMIFSGAPISSINKTDRH